MAEYDRLVEQFSWNIPHEYNLGHAVSDLQVRQGHDTAIIIVDDDWRETRYSFRLLSDYSSRLANRLVADGFAQGDRIAVILPPSVEAAIAHIGILKAGMISVPILPDVKPGTFVERLGLSGAAAVVTSSAVAEDNGRSWSALGNLRQVYVVSDGPGSAPMGVMERLLAESRPDFRVPPTTSATPALLGFTSGSEGAAKGVLHAHSIVLGGQPALLFSETPRPRQIIWSHFEWGWLGGLLVALGAWHFGCAIVLHHQPVLVPSKTIELLCRTSVNHVSIAPTTLKMLQVGARSAVYPKLSSITSGGEKLDAATRDWVEGRFGIPLSEIYGLSECGAVLGSGYILPIREGAVGKPPPGQKVHIISPTGEKLGDDEPGLIAVQAPHPSMYLGYWQEEAATAARFFGNLFNTGDLGYRDSEGYFWYVSRGDDVINAAGHRVGPGEIEEIFSGFPGIELCAVAGVPSALVGETIVLWVKLTDDAEPEASMLEMIFAHARQRLAPYQIPHSVRFVDEIPMTATGKVHRRAVREQEIALTN